eukprot:g31026.t1
MHHGGEQEKSSSVEVESLNLTVTFRRSSGSDKASSDSNQRSSDSSNGDEEGDDAQDRERESKMEISAGESEPRLVGLEMRPSYDFGPSASSRLTSHDDYKRIRDDSCSSPSLALLPASPSQSASRAHSAPDTDKEHSLEGKTDRLVTLQRLFDLACGECLDMLRGPWARFLNSKEGKEVVSRLSDPSFSLRGSSTLSIKEEDIRQLRLNGRTSAHSLLRTPSIPTVHQLAVAELVIPITQQRNTLHSADQQGRRLSIKSLLYKLSLRIALPRVRQGRKLNEVKQIPQPMSTMKQQLPESSDHSYCTFFRGLIKTLTELRSLRRDELFVGLLCRFKILLMICPNRPGPGPGARTCPLCGHTVVLPFSSTESESMDFVFQRLLRAHFRLLNSIIFITFQADGTPAHLSSEAQSRHHPPDSRGDSVITDSITGSNMNRTSGSMWRIYPCGEAAYNVVARHEAWAGGVRAARTFRHKAASQAGATDFCASAGLVHALLGALEQGVQGRASTLAELCASLVLALLSKVCHREPSGWLFLLACLGSVSLMLAIGSTSVAAAWPVLPAVVVTNSTWQCLLETCLYAESRDQALAIYS